MTPGCFRSYMQRVLVPMCLIASLAHSEELTCPSPMQAASTKFPDSSGAPPKSWYATRYRVEPPKLTAESKLSFEEVYLNPNFVQCKYKVEGGATVRVQSSRLCKKARGKWNDQGENAKCTGENVSECVVDCE